MRGMSRHQPRMLDCPHCGAAFKAGRAACPECGSDDSTGWRPTDEIEYESLDIPDYYEPPEERGIPERIFNGPAAYAFALLALAIVSGVAAFVIYAARAW